MASRWCGQENVSSKNHLTWLKVTFSLNVTVDAPICVKHASVLKDLLPLINILLLLMSPLYFPPCILLKINIHSCKFIERHSSTRIISQLPTAALLEAFVSELILPAAGSLEGNSLLSTVMLMSQKTSSSSRSASNWQSNRKKLIPVSNDLVFG